MSKEYRPIGAQMKKLNPVIRNAVYTALYTMQYYKDSLKMREFMGSQVEMIPGYWEEASFNELSNLFFKGCNSLVALFELLFKFGNVLNIELFCFGSQNSSSSFKRAFLTLSALLNTLKIPVNGY